MHPPKKLREVDLYTPVKRYLESLGYQVKGEIGSCDLVGLRDDGRVVIVGELKLNFTLELVLQAVDRIGAADEVWLAVHMGGSRERDRRVRKLCRLLGFGLLGVSSAETVELLVSPGPYRPRSDLTRCSPDAQKILLGNVYGWFERVQHGLYTLSETGRAALVHWKHVEEGSSLVEVHPR